MTKNISEEELLLRKRARRRLLGALALVIVAVIILPVVFDQPKQTQQQAIDVNVSGADQTLPGKTDSAIETLPDIKTNEEIGLTQHVPEQPEVFILNEDEAPVETLDVILDEKGQVVEITNTATAKPADNLVNIPIPGRKPAVPVAPVVTDVAIEQPVQNKTAVVKPAVAVKPKEAVITRTEKAVAPLSRKEFVIQLGAFSDHAKAKQQQQNLVSNGINAYTEMRTIDNNQITRVRIGPFSTRSAAEQELARLVRQGLNGVVTTQ